MKLSLCLATILVIGSTSEVFAAPASYYECILDRIPDATAEWEANLFRRQCRVEFPDYYSRASAPKKTGVLDPSAESCITKNLPARPFRVVKQLVTEACRALYE